MSPACPHWLKILSVAVNVAVKSLKQPRATNLVALIFDCIDEPWRARTSDPLIKSHVAGLCEQFVSVATINICYRLQPLAIARTTADLRRFLRKIVTRLSQTGASKKTNLSSI
jgi:hypothetical protein